MDLFSLSIIRGGSLKQLRNPEVTLSPWSSIASEICLKCIYPLCPQLGVLGTNRWSWGINRCAERPKTARERERAEGEEPQW